MTRRIRLKWGNPYGACPNLSRNAKVYVRRNCEWRFTDVFIVHSPHKERGQRYEVWQSSKPVEKVGSLEKAKQLARKLVSSP